MSDLPCDQASAVEHAARRYELYGFTVLDRDWRSGEHHLDLVAASARGTLTGVLVAPFAPRHGGRDPILTNLDVLVRLQRAVRAWNAGHGAGYEFYEVDSVMFARGYFGGMVFQQSWAVG
jgi:hypothetical protein